MFFFVFRGISEASKPGITFAKIHGVFLQRLEQLKVSFSKEPVAFLGLGFFYNLQFYIGPLGGEIGGIVSME